MAHLAIAVSPEAAAVLSREERRRADACRSDRERRRYVVAHVALREVLAGYVDTPAAALRFARNDWGKPSLDTPNPPRFSLAHSADLALIAVTASTEVGVDVEPVAPVPDCLEIARAYFSLRERTELAALPPETREHGFLRCWTRKEALVKAAGRGLALRLDSFDVSVAPDDASVLMHINGDGTLWSVRTLVPQPGYVAAVALHGAVGTLQHMGVAPLGQPPGG
jgi:4'-phosphopantetheinyl transferase